MLLLLQLLFFLLQLLFSLLLLMVVVSVSVVAVVGDVDRGVVVGVGDVVAVDGVVLWAEVKHQMFRLFV